MQSLPARLRRPLLGWLAVFAGILWLTPRTFWLDDPYIALHSARVVLSGADPIFNVPGLTGATSPAYVGLIVLLLAARVPPFVALWLANALGTLAFVAGVWTLAAVSGLSIVKRLIVIGVTLSAGYVWAQLANGLETSWAGAAIVWLMVCVRRDLVLPAGALAGLVPALRPDLMPAAGLLLLVALWREPRPDRRIIALLAAAAVLAPFALWVRLDTGAWLPAPMRAKAMFYADACLTVREKLRQFPRDLAGAALLLFPLSLGLVALAWQPLGRIGLAAMAVAFSAYFLLFPGGLSFNLFRYPAAILVPWAVLGLTDWIAARGRLVTAALAIAGAALAPLSKVPLSEGADDLVAGAMAVDAHVPADGIVLIQDAGAVSEFAHRRAVDFVGLKTPSSIDVHGRLTFPSCGASRAPAIAAIARSAGASHLMITASWDSAYHIVDGLAAQGIMLTPIWTQARAFPFGYRLYRINNR